jgi:hypothetical protein
MHILRLEIHVARQQRLVETGRLRQKEESLEACRIKERKLWARLDDLSRRMTLTPAGKGWKAERNDAVICVSAEPRRVLVKAGRINSLMEARDLPLMVLYEEEDFEGYPSYVDVIGLTFTKFGRRLVTKEPLIQGKGFAGRERHNNNL